MRSLRRPSHGPYSAPESPPPPPGVVRATCWPTGLVAAPVAAPSAPAAVPLFAVARLGPTAPRESADEPSPATGGGGRVGAWDAMGGAGAAVDGLGQVTGGNASCACAGIGTSGAGTTSADAGGGIGGGTGVGVISARGGGGGEVSIFSMGAGGVGVTFFGGAGRGGAASDGASGAAAIARAGAGLGGRGAASPRASCRAVGRGVSATTLSAVRSTNSGESGVE